MECRILIDHKNVLAVKEDSHWRVIDYTTGAFHKIVSTPEGSFLPVSVHDARQILKADQIAVKAHAGTVDKAGKPYITHPVRVTERLPLNESDPLAVNKICAALLHDTVEDTDVTMEQIKTAFDVRTWKAVELLTHEESIPYLDYVRNAITDDVARAVKKSDLIDNMDLSRITHPVKRDYERIEKKYRPAMKLILEAEKKQNP